MTYANLDTATAVIFDEGKKGVAIYDPKVVIWVIRNYVHKYWNQGDDDKEIRQLKAELNALRAYLEQHAPLTLRAFEQRNQERT